jgi:hypothetical protein
MNRVFALPENRFLLAAFSGAFVLVFLAMANDGAGGPDTGSYAEPAGVLGVVLALLSGAVAIRSWRIEVRLSPTRLTVRNLIRTHHLAPTDVERIGWARSPLLGRVPVVRARNGRTVRLDALSFSILTLPWMVRRSTFQLRALASELDAPYDEFC